MLTLSYFCSIMIMIKTTVEKGDLAEKKCLMRNPKERV